MATKAAAAKKKPAETASESGESPLIDATKDALKKMMAGAKERGYVTYDELNAALPEDQFSSEKIEDVMAKLSEMGINVIEADDAEDSGKATKDKDEKEEKRKSSRFREKPNRLSALTTLFGCICARWGALNCSPARARLLSPSGLRPGATP